MSPTVSAMGGARRPTIAEWKALVAKFQEPSVWRATWQIVDTLVPYIGLWVLMYFTVSISWWLTIPIAMLTGLLLVRIFIIFHDCGHGSFFKSKLANDITGFIAGLLTITPYYHWRWEHSLHHATSSDLDRRGTGDVWTLTVEEYLQSSRWRRFAYRLARNPFVLFVLAPTGLFLVRQRFPSPKATPRERHSVWWMNFAILGMVLILGSIYGFGRYAILQLAVTMTAGAAGVWLFYVQHQFEDAYWERKENWDYTTAALQGSSFYKLPRVLQWLSGNIGFHHIHHLSPRIANYNLERCHKSSPVFQDIKPLTLRTSLKSLRFRLWDEQSGGLVGFRHLRSRRSSKSQSTESSEP
ncbi:MAG TPA: fatty acid desaturase [Prosthecobacter sp.]|nr:fatty acid desaturase [Prosthecobacter sp.]